MSFQKLHVLHSKKQICSVRFPLASVFISIICSHTNTFERGEKYLRNVLTAEEKIFAISSRPDSSKADARSVFIICDAKAKKLTF